MKTAKGRAVQPHPPTLLFRSLFVVVVCGCSCSVSNHPSFSALLEGGVEWGRRERGVVQTQGRGGGRRGMQRPLLSAAVCCIVVLTLGGVDAGPRNRKSGGKSGGGAPPSNGGGRSWTSWVGMVLPEDGKMGTEKSMPTVANVLESNVPWVIEFFATQSLLLESSTTPRWVQEAHGALRVAALNLTDPAGMQMALTLGKHFHVTVAAQTITILNAAMAGASVDPIASTPVTLAHNGLLRFLYRNLGHTLTFTHNGTEFEDWMNLGRRAPTTRCLEDYISATRRFQGNRPNVPPAEQQCPNRIPAGPDRDSAPMRQLIIFTNSTQGGYEDAEMRFDKLTDKTVIRYMQHLSVKNMFYDSVNVALFETLSLSRTRQGWPLLVQMMGVCGLKHKKFDHTMPLGYAIGTEVIATSYMGCGEEYIHLRGNLVAKGSQSPLHAWVEFDFEDPVRVECNVNGMMSLEHLQMGALCLVEWTGDGARAWEAGPATHIATRVHATHVREVEPTFNNIVSFLKDAGVQPGRRGDKEGTPDTAAGGGAGAAPPTAHPPVESLLDADDVAYIGPICSEDPPQRTAQPSHAHRNPEMDSEDLPEEFHGVEFDGEAANTPLSTTERYDYP